MQRINKTRFMEQEELAANLTKLNKTENTYETGGVPLLVHGDQIYVDGSDSHTLIFGATGSKKTRLVIFPSIGILARAGEAFVTTDPKGELFARTSADVESFGYDVDCLNFRDFSKGTCWNLLDLPYRYYYEGRKTKAHEILYSIAQMVIGDTIDEKFWADSGVNVIMGLMLYLLDHSTRAEYNMDGVIKLWMSYLEDRSKFIRKLRTEYTMADMVYQKLSSLDNKADKTVGSIEAIVSMGLNRFILNPDFLEYVSKNELKMEEMAKKKSAIYLITPDENHTYDFVVSMFIKQYYEVLIETAQNSPGGQLPYRTNFLIDEFANLPTIEGIDVMITASRSRNIRFVLVIQALSQLKEKYNDFTDTICSNCNNWIYLFSREIELLQMLQTLCGTVVYDNHSEAPLCSIFDLQHMDKEKGEALVLSGRNYPCRVNLADINEYPYPIGCAEMKKEEPAEGDIDVDAAEKDMQSEETVKKAENEETIKRQKKIKRYFVDIEKNTLVNDEPELPNFPCYLFAVGPNEMIMDVKTAYYQDIMNGTAMPKYLLELTQKWGMDAWKLGFYWCDTIDGRDYDEMLAKSPEKVYLTVSELGVDLCCMRKEGNEEGEWTSRKDKKYVANLSCREEKNGGKDCILKIGKSGHWTVEDFGGTLGQDYVLRYVSRLANEKLKDTELENSCWGNCSMDEKNNSVKITKIADDYTAYLTVRRYNAAS